MKYALIFGLVLVVFWLWRSNRQTRVTTKTGGAPSGLAEQPATSTQIVACKVCGLHLPHTDALAGKQGLYCSTAHRQQAGD